MKKRPQDNLPVYDTKANFKFIIDEKYISENVLNKFEERIKLKDTQWVTLSSKIANNILPKIDEDIKLAIEDILFYEELMRRNKRAISAESCYVVKQLINDPGIKPWERYHYFLNQKDADLFIQYHNGRTGDGIWIVEKAN